MSISENIQQLQKELSSAKLMVVTKNRSSKEIREVIEADITDIGENRLQEIEEKYDLQLFRELQNAGVKLHFIGHLQSNKVPKAVRLCDSIQTVDSLRLAKKINQAVERIGKVMPIFLQLNLTGEEQKYGLREDQISEIIEAINQLANIQLIGFMCMGKQGDPEATRQAFRRCKQLADQFKLSEVSMGMSGDYQIALEEGSTMVRIGSAVF